MRPDAFARASSRLPSREFLGLLGLGLELLEQLQRQLEVAALAPTELASLLVDELHQELKLRVLRERDPPELLDVLLALEVTAVHVSFRSQRAIRNNRFSRDHDR